MPSVVHYLEITILTPGINIGVLASIIIQVHIHTRLVGFINPRSLMDWLPSKGSTQQMTLRTMCNSWAGPNT